MMNDWGNTGGWGWGGWLAMAVMMIVFWVVVGWVVVTMIRRNGTQPAPVGPPLTDPQSNPAGILDERFARGEIDVDEYTRRRTILNERP
jgi:putative membrane protein